MDEMTVKLVSGPSLIEIRECKRAALTTIGKRLLTDPDDVWLHVIADAEHSPIRELVFKFDITAPYWVLNELRTHHVGCEMYMQSSRNDRQKDFDRNTAPQGMMRNARFSANLQSMIDISHKRLCNCASSMMRWLVFAMCNAIEQEYLWTVGLFKPMCDYRGGICHEVKPCGKRPWAYGDHDAL